MLKKLLFISFFGIVLIVLVQGKNNIEKLSLQDAHTQILLPGSGQQVPANLLEVRQSNNHRAPKAIRLKTLRSSFHEEPQLNRDDLLWTIRHVDDNSEYYLSSGAADDTFAVVFNPPAPCVVTEVYTQWYSGGSIQVFGAQYSAEAMTLSPDGECSLIPRGSFDGSPIGELYTPITQNIVEDYIGDWSYQMDIGGTFIVIDSTAIDAGSPFLIGIIKEDVHPFPLADATDDQDSLTYTWFGGPWTDGQWGCYSSSIELMMMVKVTYPFVESFIIVQSLTLANNTYNTDGPFTIIADLMSGVHDGVAIDESDSIVFHWTVNEIETTGSMTPVNVLPDGNGLYAYDITGPFNVGDEIEYWITATSNEGFPTESIHLSFEIKEPEHPNAELLIVADREVAEQAQADLYRTVADELGVTYEFWNTDLEQGIDSSIINAGWSNIIVYGWGTETIPVVSGETDPGYASFLDNGGSLVLADQDWYFSHGLHHELQFSSGDFAYDYFGIGSAINDLYNNEGISIADTAFIGFAATEMDMPFTANPFTLRHSIYGTSNWSDPLIPFLGNALFRGANDSLIYGTFYESATFKTAYFSFMPDAAVDTSEESNLTYLQFAEFFSGVLQWLGVPTDIDNMLHLPTEFKLAQNHPNPFNPTTHVSFELPVSSHITLYVYNIRGQKVIELINNNYDAGRYSVEWDGRDGNGLSVDSGLYFCRLVSDDFRATNKMLLLK